MLRQCGFRNAFENESRYPQVSLAAIASRRPQIVLLSSEPYPFKEKHIDEIHLALPNARILLVDGEMFSWYGSRMLYAAQYFVELREKIHRLRGRQPEFLLTGLTHITAGVEFAIAQPATAYN